MTTTYAAMDDTRTVDRRLAHKCSTEQVFVTDTARDGDTLLAVGHLPRLHRFFNDAPALRYDALLLTEFVRQGIEVIAHTLLGVPLSSQFVLRTVDLEILAPDALRFGERPATAVVAVAAARVRRNRQGVAYAVSGPVHCSIGGRPAARLGGLLGFLARDTYDDLRAAGRRAESGTPDGTVTPAEPYAVGRQLPENVFIGRPQGSARQATCLVVPRAHPVYFDRPLDHYPGMQLAEAARQLATHAYGADTGAAAANVLVDRVAMEFSSFAELHVPPRLTVTGWTERDRGAELTVTARQETRTTSTYRFRLVPDDIHGGLS